MILPLDENIVAKPKPQRFAFPEVRFIVKSRYQGNWQGSRRRSMMQPEGIIE
jgi:hypothetical protein